MIRNPDRPLRSRRSVLYVPASNKKAMAKLAALSCDAVIFDLEDAVAPGDKVAAREALRGHFSDTEATTHERIIRINPLSGEWGAEDFLAARACRPDAILLPKVNKHGDITDAEDALAETDAPNSIRLWAMIETPAGLLNSGSIAEMAGNPHSRLDCFVAGTNDLAKETGARIAPGRSVFVPWLMQIVAAARAVGIDALDGVWNDYRDSEGFASECTEAAAMGFDGKTLIHPSQIESANRAFSPSHEEIANARAIRAAFALVENRNKGVISLDGKMVERLHLDVAEKLLARHTTIGDAQ